MGCGNSKTTDLETVKKAEVKQEKRVDGKAAVKGGSSKNGKTSGAGKHAFIGIGAVGARLNQEIVRSLEEEFSKTDISKQDQAGSGLFTNGVLNAHYIMTEYEAGFFEGKGKPIIIKTGDAEVITTDDQTNGMKPAVEEMIKYLNSLGNLETICLSFAANCPFASQVFNDIGVNCPVFTLHNVVFSESYSKDNLNCVNALANMANSLEMGSMTITIDDKGYFDKIAALGDGLASLYAGQMYTDNSFKVEDYFKGLAPFSRLHFAGLFFARAATHQDLFPSKYLTEDSCMGSKKIWEETGNIGSLNLVRGGVPDDVFKEHMGHFNSWFPTKKTNLQLQNNTLHDCSYTTLINRKAAVFGDSAWLDAANDLVSSGTFDNQLGSFKDRCNEFIANLGDLANEFDACYGENK
jgi:hypothetical protein